MDDERVSMGDSQGRLHIGVDVGGTFTDFHVLDEATGAVRTGKRPSTPDNPARAIIEGLEGLASRHGRDAVDRHRLEAESRGSSAGRQYQLLQVVQEAGPGPRPHGAARVDQEVGQPFGVVRFGQEYLEGSCGSRTLFPFAAGQWLAGPGWLAVAEEPRSNQVTSAGWKRSVLAL